MKKWQAGKFAMMCSSAVIAVLCVINAAGGCEDNQFLVSTGTATGLFIAGFVVFLFWDPENE